LFPAVVSHHLLIIKNIVLNFKTLFQELFIK
jgi:hypothetical protein